MQRVSARKRGSAKRTGAARMAFVRLTAGSGWRGPGRPGGSRWSPCTPTSSPTSQPVRGSTIPRGGSSGPPSSTGPTTDGASLSTSGSSWRTYGRRLVLLGEALLDTTQGGDQPAHGAEETPPPQVRIPASPHRDDARGGGNERPDKDQQARFWCEHNVNSNRPVKREVQNG